MTNIEMCDKIVRESVYMNVSCWVEALSKLISNVTYPICMEVGVEEEDIMALMERIDYEEAGRDAINDADDNELEAMCESVGVDVTDGAEANAIRNYIRINVSNWESFCNEFDVDTDDFRLEVYEHWAVTDWLGRRLSDKGECVGELCGTTVWGRCTTGQHISMDGVIKEIAKDMNQ